MESTKPRLLITGINGYIGSWTTLKALESGEYRVRGTVRDKNNKAKLAPLKEALGDRFDELELVSADLTDKASLAKAAEDCDYILHMASPFPAVEPKDEDEVIKPAVEGTVGILEAVKGSKVKRVVITSSCAAILEYSKGNLEVDEETWPEMVKGMTPYVRSKILAEKAAWDFIENLNEDEKFELCTINPGLVTGPLLVKGEGASQQIFTDLMRGTHGSAPKVHFPIVDVRNVAEAHLKALKSMPFERYAMVEGTYKVSECGKLLYDEFSQYGYKCTRKDMCKATAWVAKIFIKDLRAFYSVWDVRCHVRNDKAKRELGIDFISAKESLKDMGYSLIDHGFVPDKRK